MSTRRNWRSGDGCRSSASWICWGYVSGVLLTLAGCSTLTAWKQGKHATPTCQLPSTPTVEQIVHHLNENSRKIQGWRSDQLKIRVNHAPMTLSGTLMVQRSQRLRLQVTSMMGPEVDFGSNDELFWLWAKRAQGSNGEPAPLMFATHRELQTARQRLPFPFEPAWLMEALGVAELESTGMQMEGEGGNGVIRLISQHHLPDGQPVRRVIAVDACRGHVLEHSLWDLQGRPVIRTVLGTHQQDRRSGATLPRYIKLDWPQAELSLAMEIRQMEVNPPDMPMTAWQMPTIPNAPVVDLGRQGSRVVDALPVQTPGRLTDVYPAAPSGSSTSAITSPSLPHLPLENEDFELPIIPSSRNDQSQTHRPEHMAQPPSPWGAADVGSSRVRLLPPQYD